MSSKRKRLTSLKFNSSFSPEKCWWEDYFPFLLGLRPIFRSHVKLREGIPYFFLGFLRLPIAFEETSTPAERHQGEGDITFALREVIKKIATCRGRQWRWESWGSESWSHTPGLGGKLGVGLLNPFLQKQTTVFSSKKPAKINESMRWEGFFFFLGCLKPFPHFFGGNEWVKLWNCGDFFFQTFGAWIRGGLDMFLNNVSDRRCHGIFPTTPRGLPVWTLSQKKTASKWLLFSHHFTDPYLDAKTRVFFSIGLLVLSRHSYDVR